MKRSTFILTFFCFVFLIFGCQTSNEEYTYITNEVEGEIQDTLRVQFCNKAVNTLIVDKSHIEIGGTHAQADAKACKSFKPITLADCKKFCTKQKKGAKKCPESGAAISPPVCKVIQHQDHVVHGVTMHVVKIFATQVCGCDP